MTATKEKQNTNEFDQAIKGSSLNKDAWRRLKKNKMAITGLYIVIFYAIIAVAAPILPIYSYKKIILDHQHLPPTLTKTAGELLYAKTKHRMGLIAKKRGRRELNEKELKKLEDLQHKIKTEVLEIGGKC